MGLNLRLDLIRLIVKSQYKFRIFLGGGFLENIFDLIVRGIGGVEKIFPRIGCINRFHGLNFLAIGASECEQVFYRVRMQSLMLEPKVPFCRVTPVIFLLSPKSRPIFYLSFFPHHLFRGFLPARLLVLSLISY